MPRPLLASLILLTLAACGADGPPVAPGITIEGSASAGIIGTGN